MEATTSRGFLRPTTTPTPDEIFDIWLPILSGAALKLLLYIVRRTLGFKKDADTISLSQICNGIRTKDGKILDQGTGLARNTAIKAIKELTELGLIVVERTQDERGIHEINTYRLHFRGCDSDKNDPEEVVPSQDHWTLNKTVIVRAVMAPEIRLKTPSKRDAADTWMNYLAVWGLTDFAQTAK